jgi:hypothetical protein
MSKFDFELEHIRYSFSSLSTFNTCNYAFKLTYIDMEERIDNFFGDFGSFIHTIMEHYWNGSLPKEEMANYFEEAYMDAIQTTPPPFPVGMEAKYYEDALTFLKAFPYSREDYDVIEIEGEHKFDYKGIKFIIRPDIILREKATGKVFLFDFKTSKPVKGKKQTWDEAKMREYKRQVILYAHFFEQQTGIHIDRIKLLFVRLDREYVFEPTEAEIIETLNWLETTVQFIRWEEDFEPHVDPYFCNNICSVRQACVYRQVLFKPVTLYDYDME